MSELFLFKNATRHNPAIDEWFANEPTALFALAGQWFAKLRRCGNDVNELMHDGFPTACVGPAAFAYVAVFKAHVNLGFFTGASLSDPQQLLQGTGKRMRHIQLKPGEACDVNAIDALLKKAYDDVKRRLKAEQ
jgi:hypothetical protein